MWCGWPASPPLPPPAPMARRDALAMDRARGGRGRGSAAPSVDARLVAARGLEFSDEVARGRLAHLPGLGGDVGEGRLHVLGHALGIGARIEMRAGLAPAPQL